MSILGVKFNWYTKKEKSMNYKILPYNQSLALLTDLYELTMAIGYWRLGMERHEAVFNLSFRKNPFKSGFTIACGLGYVIDYLQNFNFDDSDLSYLLTLNGNDGKPLFEKDFLKYLKNLSFKCDIDAIPEGTIVFPHEPLIRVQGPIIQCQLFETALLNIINFQTLIATKAARVAIAAKGEPILEFGLRRAQGIDGGIAASRAAYIGGASATSSVIAGKIFGIPVKGTISHSWVMAFDDELEAFQTYAKVMPNNCVFLVDTYDTIEGVKRAIKVGHSLRKRGFDLEGIRLDSGDLSYLSIEARKILDDSGFTNTKILASNDLDELIIESLKNQDAKITVWGVGTNLVTGSTQSALDGVYKLTALSTNGKDWKYKVKVSEQTSKVSTPGILQVRRYHTRKENIADAIYDINTDISKGCTIVDPLDMTRQKKISRDHSYTDLLVPIFRQGKLVYNQPSLEKIKENTKNNLSDFHSSIKRFVNPHQYPVGIEKSLYELKTKLILEARSRKEETQNIKNEIPNIS